MVRSWKRTVVVVGAAVCLCAWAAWMFADRDPIAPGPAPGPAAARRGPTAPGATLAVAPTAGPAPVRSAAPGPDVEREAVEPAPTGVDDRSLRVVVVGLAEGEPAAVTLVGPLGAAGEPIGTTVRGVTGPFATAVFPRRTADRAPRLRVEAEGYAPHAQDLPPGLEELRVVILPCEPLVIEFPGLAGRPGRFELAGRIDHRPVVVPIDGDGRATYRSVPDHGRLDFVLRTDPERSGDDGPVALLGGGQAFDVDRRRFRFADVRAHRVELLAPVPGERFRLSFELVPPQFAAMPSKPGWSGVHGLHSPIGLDSDAAGVLVVDLLEGTATDVLFEGAVSGPRELPPFTVHGPGPVDLDR
jgi:hypothetical protein